MPAARVRRVDAIHAGLRASILSGEYAPGAVLSQVELARSFGVSRTPLREALRRLEAEGLIEALQNQRARVAALDAEALDIRWTERILLEATGVNVTVPRFTEIDLNGVLAATTALRVTLARGDAAAAGDARRVLHARYVERAGDRLRRAIGDAFAACERHRRLFVALDPSLADAYAAVAGACVGRDAAGAARLIARIEAGFARQALARIDPGYEAVALGTALRMLGTAFEPSLRGVLPDGRR